jgi:hypothetical protein
MRLRQTNMDIVGDTCERKKSIRRFCSAESKKMYVHFTNLSYYKERWLNGSVQ